MNKQLLDSLSTAVANGRTDIVRSITSACEKNGELSDNITVEELINNPTTLCGTLLHLATKLDHIDIVRTLLSAGANPGIQNNMGETPIDLIATERMTNVYSEELLKATAQSDLNRISQLINAGLSVNVKDSPNSGNTPLHWAACFGNKETIELLINHGADVNIVNSAGTTPLHDAVERGELQIVEKLIKSGGNLFLKATKGKFAGKTAFDLATDNSKMMVLLKSHLYIGEQGNNLQQRSNSMDSLSSGNDILSPSVSRLSILSSDSPLKQELGEPPYSYVSKLSNATMLLPIITDGQLHLLWPLPQKIIQTKDDNFMLSDDINVNVIHSPDNASIKEVLDLWKTFIMDVEEIGYKLNVESFLPTDCLAEKVICHINSSIFTRPESYRIVISSEQIRLLACDIRGLHNSICTFVQLLRLYKKENGIPTMCIDDWPSMSIRAVLVDMSIEARIPTLDTLKRYVCSLSHLKINELHFYVKFTPKDGWQVPYNKSQLLELGSICRENFMRLIPAIDLEDNVTVNELPDISLCIQNFLACFDKLEKLHVGPILANMIMELYKEDVSKSPWKILSVPSRITLLMCANGFLNNMELLKSIPLNIILLEYGHQAEHDYQMPCKMISQVGISCCVCTGTSAWNSLAGCPEAAINNIYHAIQANSYQNLMGLIVADWGGSPHHTSLSFSLPGVVVGVGLAWNPSVHWDYINSRLTELINTHIILDSENVLAQLILELGRIETYLLRASRKQDDHDMTNLPEVQGSILHQLLDDTDNVNLENLSVDSFQKVIRHVKYCQRELQKSKAKCHQNGEIISEIQLATELMLFACRIGKLLISIGRNPNETMGLAVINVGLVNLPPTSRTDLANKLLALIEQYRAVWLSRNLPVGLHASLLLFNNILNKLIPEDVENSRENHFSIDTADVLDYNGSV